jgi:hypothetical protein
MIKASLSRRFFFAIDCVKNKGTSRGAFILGTTNA